MTSTNLAMRGYKTMQKETASEKGIELKVFTQITSRLQSVNTEDAGGTTQLFEVLSENAKLWKIIFIDLTHEDNKLPLELKKSILPLAEFVQQHTLKVMGGVATHDVLIDINKSMIGGLRASMTKQAPATAGQIEAA